MNPVTPVRKLRPAAILSRVTYQVILRYDGDVDQDVVDDLVERLDAVVSRIAGSLHVSLVVDALDPPAALGVAWPSRPELGLGEPTVEVCPLDED